MVSAEDRAAVLEEVRLIIVEAIRDGDSIRADGIAQIVSNSYPRSGLSSAEIAQRIKDAAAAAGVPVEPWRRLTDRPAPPDHLGAAVGSAAP